MKNGILNTSKSTTDKNKHSSYMNEEIIEIIQQYKFEHIPEKQAVNELFGLFGVSYCATKIKNVLCNRFTNEAKKHVGKKIDEVPELAEMLKAIKIVEKHCS